MRRAVHQALGEIADSDAVPSSRYAFGTAEWEGCKDGKQRVAETDWRALRK